MVVLVKKLWFSQRFRPQSTWERRHRGSSPGGGGFYATSCQGFLVFFFFFNLRMFGICLGFSRKHFRDLLSCIFPIGIGTS